MRFQWWNYKNKQLSRNNYSMCGCFNRIWKMMPFSKISHCTCGVIWVREKKLTSHDGYSAVFPRFDWLLMFWFWNISGVVQSGRFVQGVGLVCHGSPTVTFSQHPLQVTSDTSSYRVVHMTRCQFWAHAFARSTVVASSNVYVPPRGCGGGRTLSGLLWCHISLTASHQYNTTSLSLLGQLQCAETERSPAVDQTLFIA